MGASTARKLDVPEGPDREALDEKRRHGIRLLMSAIWHRHNPQSDNEDGNAEQTKRKDYLAEIW